MRGTMFDSAKTISTFPTPAAELSALAAAVTDLLRPVESTFLSLGEALLTCVQVLENIDRDFSGLSDLLASPDAETAKQALREVVGGVVTMAEHSSGIADGLVRMDTTTAASFRPLAELTKIAGEIGTLGMNAKIQAAQIGSAGIDFSVFTTEISRLKSTAEKVIGAASDRFHKVWGMIRAVRTAEADALAIDNRDIGTTPEHFDTIQSTLSERHSRAVTAADDIRKRSRAITARIAACISRMQIADRTSQRLGHVRDALKLLADLADGKAAEDWDKGQRQALVAAGSDLQARQFGHAIREFADAVGQLRNDIVAMAEELQSIAAEASAVFGCGGNTSFLTELHVDTQREVVVLQHYAVLRGQVQTRIGELISELNQMSADMDAVRDIDAEMRVVGLNASFKCGRLGSQGRALSVIAHELRTCSGRTEEASKAVVAAMKETIDTAGWLSGVVADERIEADRLADCLSMSVQSLARLSEDVGHHVQGVLGKWNKATAILADAGSDITLHQEMVAKAQPISDGLHTLVSNLGDISSVYDPSDDLHLLLGQHYTMGSERAVHDNFSRNTTGSNDENEENLVFF